MGKRKSRWDCEKVVIPGMPTMLPDDLTPDQERLYLLQLQIEELTLRIRTNDLRIPPERDRSPSPEPVYDIEGKRLNTREVRTMKKMEYQRHLLIQKMLVDNPSYHPPPDYKPPVIKVKEKVLIPQEDFQDINFVGLLIGPRGNTLKSMERESGAKIVIRGKGSVKEGKSKGVDGRPAPGEDDPLHAFVTGTTEEQVRIAVDRIKEIVKQGIEVPENKNNLRKTQLRELAIINGTLRENDSRCNNCGSNLHKSWQCPERPNITNAINCTNCGGVGHLLRDCKEPRRSMLHPDRLLPNSQVPRMRDDPIGNSSSGYGSNTNFKTEVIEEDDYEKLMAELGES